MKFRASSSNEASRSRIFSHHTIDRERGKRRNRKHGGTDRNIRPRLMCYNFLNVPRTYLYVLKSRRLYVCVYVDLCMWWSQLGLVGGIRCLLLILFFPLPFLLMAFLHVRIFRFRSCNSSASRLFCATRLSAVAFEAFRERERHFRAFNVSFCLISNFLRREKIKLFAKTYCIMCFDAFLPV